MNAGIYPAPGVVITSGTVHKPGLLLRKKSELPLRPLCVLSDKEYVDLLERVFANGVVLEIRSAPLATTVIGADARIFRIEAGMTWRLLDQGPSKKN